MTETGRLETFADGVFAIAITPLVLGIVPPAPDDDLGATLLYGGTMVGIAIMFNAIWRYASAHDGHLLGSAASPGGRVEARGYRYGVPIYLAITLLAFLSPYLSLAGFLAFAAYWALPISGPSAERPID